MFNTRPAMTRRAARKVGPAGGKPGRGFEEEQAPFEAVIKAAERSGLLGEKSCRISGRVSRALLEQAKRRTGIESDTELIEFALASVALEDDFPEAFKAARGKVDPDLELGF
jgi:hypothetical protein